MTLKATISAMALLIILSGCEGRRKTQPLARQKILSAQKLSLSSSVQAKDEKPKPSFPDNPSLSDYLAYAALNNPALEAAFNHWKASLEQVPQVKALPDPRFTYRYYIREVETRVGPQRNSLQLAQTFPWLSKLKLRGGAAMDAADAASQQFQAEKLKLFRQVKDAYYDFYYLGRAISITKENLRLLEHVESVVRARYRAGTAEHPDLIRVQVELGKLSDRMRSLIDMKSPVEAHLAALLNLPAEKILPLPTEIEPAEISASDQDLIDWAIENNPQLKTLEAQVTRSKKNIQLAQQEYIPDVTLGLTWIDTGNRLSTPKPSDSGQDAVIAMASVNVPIWFDRIKAGVRQARFRHVAASKLKADKTNSLIAELKLASYRYRDAQGKINLYRKVLLPKAEESLKVNEAAYRSGKVSFSDLVDAQRILLEFQLTLERALADRAKQLAKLDMLVGTDIPRSQSDSHTNNTNDAIIQTE